MGISALVNWWVSGRLMKVEKQTESIALESDAGTCGLMSIRHWVFLSASLSSG
jgi:hypothetical protein